MTSPSADSGTPYPPHKRTSKLLWRSSAIIGFILICLNIWGCFIPLRSPVLMVDFPEQISLTAAHTQAAADQDSLDRSAYLHQVTEAVHQGIVHTWGDVGINRYNLRVPIHENYILFALSYLYPPLFEKYEYNNYRKAVERGVGLCSQQAIILTKILDNRDIPAKIVGLDGHVVVTAQANPQSDQWWILDPDYGVVIDQDLASIERNPATVSPYYAGADYPEAAVSKLVSIYDESGNFIPAREGSIVYHPNRPVLITLEVLAYVMKWALPLGLILPFILNLSRGGNRKNQLLSPPPIA